jgi:urease subunit gamma/beta
VYLTPAELDRLLLFQVAELARRRLERGLRLNVPEATAIVADTVCEAARDGARLADAVTAGRRALGRDQVLPGVADAVPQVLVEAVFDDGSRLAVVPEPFGPPTGEPPRPGWVETAATPSAQGSEPLVIEVTNTAGVPITVTSHFHFFEANPRLLFDRAAAFGRHLAVGPGGHVRFPPQESRTVELALLRGERVIVGFSGLVDGPLDAPGVAEKALERARACGYLDSADDVIRTNGPDGAVARAIAAISQDAL